jgi:pyruvate kinase
MRRHRSCKIVATLGPASSTDKMIEKLFLAGVDVFRLNFSHGSHDDHKARYDAIRAIEKKYTRPISILADLQGPKHRVGKFNGDKVHLKTGQTFTLDMDKALGDGTRVCLPHKEVFDSVKKGTFILLDDGKIKLEVEKVSKDKLTTTVVVGGTLSNHKGFNIPNAVLKLDVLTEKDLKDLDFALKLGADWIALSFVQTADDIRAAQKIIKGRAAIVAKIEKPSAVKHMAEIIKLTDAIMVARGDLGVEMNPEDVPSIQKHLVREARKAGKPVIVATQMLESMITAPTPTRAEASDVATAVYDGADAVMLSAETASGEYPLESVSIMDRVIKSVEKDDLYRTLMAASGSEPDKTVSDAITRAAGIASALINAAAIVTFTSSGNTSIRAARERPNVPILSLTEKITTARQLSLVWGVHSVYGPAFHSFDHVVEEATAAALGQQIAKKGDTIIITAGVPFGTPGTTNIMRVVEV